MPSLGFGSSSLFDLNDLATAIHAAMRANVMRLLDLAAVRARYKRGHGDVVMASAIALMCPADSLLW
jgi:hypothetical protein